MGSPQGDGRAGESPAAKSHRLIKLSLSVLSFVDHIAIVYFNVDRFWWDLDAAHSADTQSFKYWTLITTVVYGVCVSVMFLAWAARAWYCFNPLLCEWKRPAGQRGIRQMAWVEELSEWNAALSLGIGPTSIIPCVRLLAWNFVGTYPREYLVAIVLLTLFSIAINSALFFFYSEDEEAYFPKSYLSQWRFETYEADVENESESESDDEEDHKGCCKKKGAKHS
jgi:hypothetical protein